MNTTIIFALLAGLAVGALVGWLLKRSGRRWGMLANPPGGAVIGACVAMLAAGTVGGCSPGNYQTISSSSELESLTSQGKPVLLEFYKDGCPACIQIAPELDAAAREHDGQVIFAKANFSQSGQLARRFNVRATPTTLLFVDGAEVGRWVGFKNKKEIGTFLQRHTSAVP